MTATENKMIPCPTAQMMIDPETCDVVSNKGKDCNCEARKKHQLQIGTAKVVKFECEHCGKCCYELIGDRGGGVGKLGIYITPAETHLFPKEHLVPLYGIGTKGKSRPRPKKVIAYQLDLNRCPHYDEKIGCKIYDQRPGICRSFPFESIGIASRACSNIAKQLDHEGQAFLVDTATIKQEKEASEKATKYLIHWRERGSFWIWPLDKKHWVKVTMKAR